MRRVLLTFFAITFLHVPAMAFDCVPIVSNTDVIFKGKVIDIAPSGKPPYSEDGSKRLPDKQVTYKVLKNYKGKPNSIAKVLYYSHSASDSMPRSIGENRWVYANWDTDKTQMTDKSCGAVRSPEELDK